MTAPLLEVRDLHVRFRTPRGLAKAVDGVSFALAPGETLGLVGESGCGKSVTALSLLKLVPPPGEIAGGAVLLEGRNVLELSGRELRAVRGKEIAMIFQEPMTSLNPVFTIGDQIGEAIRIHERASRREERERVIELLRLVRIPAPEARIGEYPNQLSGGMRQRAMIAMALACNPKVLIADEPTTALDVTIQAQVLDLLAELKERLGMAVILITHDLGVVSEVCARVAVMYAGRIVEEAPTRELFANPRHPYTVGLLRSVPKPRLHHGRRERLAAIAGTVPDLTRLPAGCRFESRCPNAEARCREAVPGLDAVGPDHRARCFFPERAAEANFEPEAAHA